MEVMPMAKWAFRFFVLGVIVAITLALLFQLEHKNLVSWSIPEGVYIWLWPSSLLLLGMGEAPDSKWFDLIWETVTIAVNGLIYAMLGTVCVGAVTEFRKVKPH
jgi:branched-subunit amino acid transport protein